MSDDYECYLRNQITQIQLETERAIKPYLDRLVEIKRLTSPPSITITKEQAIKAGLTLLEPPE